MDDDESLYRIKAKQRKGILYGSFLLCLLSGSLSGAAFGTEYWVVSGVSNSEDTSYTGDFNAGLFKGKSGLTAFGYSEFAYQGKHSCVWCVVLCVVWCGVVCCVVL